jgi:hypothetical protein
VIWRTTVTNRCRWGLLAVVTGYAATVLALTDRHRNLAYDEAIYLSQVYPGPALPFTAPRARGLPLLLTPLGWFDASVPTVRGYLLAVETALMYLGFNAWIPVLRGRAVAAAAVFGVGWLPLFYATEAFPNLPVALGALAAGGYLARYLSGVGGRSSLAASALAVALVALIRPSEAVFVTFGLGLAALTRPGRELARRWGLLALALAAGWVPWLIEGQVRFDGPLHRLAAATANVGGGFHPANVRRHLDFTDGPVSGASGDNLPRLGLLWWLLIVLAVLVLIARALLTRARSGRVSPRVRAGLVAAAVAGAVAGQYLLFTGVLEARFLLPAYAAAAVALAAALPGCPRIRRTVPGAAGRALAALLVVGLGVLFVGFAGWQFGVTERVEQDQLAARELARTLADGIRPRMTRPCVLAGEVAFPVIAFETGCHGAPFRPESPDITVAGLPDRTRIPPVYVLTTTNPSRTGVHPVPASVQDLGPLGAPGWWFFTATANEVFAAR